MNVRDFIDRPFPAIADPARRQFYGEQAFGYMRGSTAGWADLPEVDKANWCRVGESLAISGWNLRGDDTKILATEIEIERAHAQQARDEARKYADALELLTTAIEIAKRGLL